MRLNRRHEVVTGLGFVISLTVWRKWHLFPPGERRMVKRVRWLP